MDKIPELTTEEQDAIAEQVNYTIAVYKHQGRIDTGLVSDGYHTFGELYEHRITLWMKLCEMLFDIDNDRGELQKVWKSKNHSDGGNFDGWFILGYGYGKDQITYHLPLAKWDDCYFAKELGKAPEFDGHTSADVLQRLKEL